MADRPRKEQVPLSGLEIELSGQEALKTLGELASIHLKPNSAALRDARIIDEMIRKAYGK